MVVLSSLSIFKQIKRIRGYVFKTNERDYAESLMTNNVFLRINRKRYQLRNTSFKSDVGIWDIKHKHKNYFVLGENASSLNKPLIQVKCN